MSRLAQFARCAGLDAEQFFGLSRLFYMVVIHAPNIPPDPDPAEPTLLLRDASENRALRHVLAVVEEQGGQAVFVGMDRSAKRLMGKICKRLPDKYQGEIVGRDPKSELPSVHYRVERREWRLTVRRKDLPLTEPPEFPPPASRRGPRVW